MLTFYQKAHTSPSSPITRGPRFLMMTFLSPIFRQYSWTVSNKYSLTLSYTLIVANARRVHHLSMVSFQIHPHCHQLHLDPAFSWCYYSHIYPNLRRFNNPYAPAFEYQFERLPLPSIPITPTSFLHLDHGGFHSAASYFSHWLCLPETRSIVASSSKVYA